MSARSKAGSGRHDSGSASRHPETGKELSAVAQLGASPISPRPIRATMAGATASVPACVRNSLVAAALLQLAAAAAYLVVTFVLTSITVPRLAALHCISFAFVCLVSLATAISQHVSTRILVIRLHNNTKFLRVAPVYISGSINAVLLAILGFESYVASLETSRDWIKLLVQITAIVETAVTFVAVMAYAYLVCKYAGRSSAYFRKNSHDDGIVDVENPQHALCSSCQKNLSPGSKGRASTAGAGSGAGIGAGVGRSAVRSAARSISTSSSSPEPKPSAQECARLREENNRLREALSIEREANKNAQEVLNKIRSFDSTAMDFSISPSPSPPVAAAARDMGH